MGTYIRIHLVVRLGVQLLIFRGDVSVPATSGKSRSIVAVRHDPPYFTPWGTYCIGLLLRLAAGTVLSHFSRDTLYNQT